MAPACACWQPLAIASTVCVGYGDELAVLVGQRRRALVQRAQHEAQART